MTEPTFTSSFRADRGNEGENLALLGEAPLVVLREDERSVDDDVELAASTRSDLCGCGGARLDLGCETRSPCVVAASGGTEENLDPHAGRVPVRRLSTRALVSSSARPR